MADVREAVLGLRRGKGMVLDADDHDTWSAGSFFTNPVVDPAAVPDGAPAWPQADGRVKMSAAWLIEHAGFGKGYGAGPRSRALHASTPSRSPTGAARTTDDLLAVAREVRDGVERRTASGWSTSRCWSAARSDRSGSRPRRSPSTRRRSDEDQQHEQAVVAMMPITMPAVALPRPP